MSAAENELRCNHLQCRKELALEGKAVVTTCSHIFCINCANELFSKSQTCPACDQKLTEPDDLVVSTLNPTNDYKASILAGLAPSVILEIASRAMSFWTYQTSQESAFQAMVLRNAQERMGHMEKQLNNAHTDLQNAHHKMGSLETDLDLANRRIQDVVQETREKDKEMTRLRGNYDKIKRKALLGGAARVVESLNDHVQMSEHGDIPRYNYDGQQAGRRTFNQNTFAAPTPIGSGPRSFQPTPMGKEPPINQFKQPYKPAFANQQSRQPTPFGTYGMTPSQTSRQNGGFRVLLVPTRENGSDIGEGRFGSVRSRRETGVFCRGPELTSAVGPKVFGAGF